MSAPSPGDAVSPEVETILAQAFAREEIPYPAARFADAVAEYADVHRFIAVIRAADAGEGRSVPLGRSDRS